MLSVLLLNVAGYLIVLLRSSFVAVCALRVLLGLASCGMFQTPFVMGETGDGISRNVAELREHVVIDRQTWVNCQQVNT